MTRKRYGDAPSVIDDRPIADGEEPSLSSQTSCHMADFASHPAPRRSAGAKWKLAVGADTPTVLPFTGVNAPQV
jgi:hypothetical protein